MERVLSWKAMSKLRGELYGLAILSIIAFHYFEGVEGAGATNSMLYTMARIYDAVIGSIGVDVFVFLSGFCIYYSLSKRPPLGTFYIRRVRRVLVPYLVIGLAFWATKDLVVLHTSFRRFLFDYSMLSFWFGGVRTVWYVTFILLMYLLSPLVARTLDAGVPSLVWALGWLIANIALSIYKPHFYGNTEVALMRAPLFLVGMGCGKLAQKNPYAPAPFVWMLAVAVPLKIYMTVYLPTYGRIANWFYSCLLIAIIVLAHGAMESRLGPRSALCRCDRFLRRAGACSFELYLSHVLIRNLMGTVGIDVASPLNYLVCIVASVPAALALERLQGLPQAKR